MKARIVLVSITIIAIVGLACMLPRAAHPAPIPKEVAKEKSWSELIIGKWKKIESTVDGREHNTVGDDTIEFSRDGKATERYVHPRTGTVNEDSADYRLDGKMIVSSSGGISHLIGEIHESTYVVESLTEQRMVLVITSKICYDRATAEKIAYVRQVPVEQVLPEGNRQEREVRVYIRVTNE